MLGELCAGALSKTVIAPIETIRMQVMGNKVCCSMPLPTHVCCSVACVCSLPVLNGNIWLALLAAPKLRYD